MKLKSLEQIRNETKHIPRQEVFHIIKKYKELNSILLNEFYNISKLSLRGRRLLDDKYNVIIIDLDKIKQLPEDIILRDLDFSLSFPQNREETAKCLYVLSYLCVEPVNATYLHCEVKVALNSKKITDNDLMHHFVFARKLINDYINFGFLERDEVGDLNRKELLESYDKLVASGEMARYDKYMNEYRKSYVKLFA